MPLTLTPETAPALEHMVAADGQTITFPLHAMDTWDPEDGTLRNVMDNLLYANPMAAELYGIRSKLFNRQSVVTIPTAEGLNAFAETHLRPLGSTSLQAAHVGGGRLPLVEYARLVAENGVIPLASKLYLHDVTFHALGALMLPETETDTYREILADAVAMEAKDHSSGQRYLEIAMNGLELASAALSLTKINRANLIALTIVNPVELGQKRQFTMCIMKLGQLVSL